MFKKHLAKNLSINLETQRILVNDKNHNIRIYLAQNPSIDLETQRILANDEDYYVRRLWAYKIFGNKPIN